jgi:hypothetical protein
MPGWTLPDRAYAHGRIIHHARRRPGYLCHRPRADQQRAEELAVGIVKENRFGRSRRNREAKKPKAAKQATQAASTFLRPQLTSSQTNPKESTK